MYNFVLDSCHAIVVNGIRCCTFGHEFKGEKVEHEYFGSKKIIEDLIKFDNNKKINERIL